MIEIETGERIIFAEDIDNFMQLLLTVRKVNGKLLGVFFSRQADSDRLKDNHRHTTLGKVVVIG